MIGNVFSQTPGEIDLSELYNTWKFFRRREPHTNQPKSKNLKGLRIAHPGFPNLCDHESPTLPVTLWIPGALSEQFSLHKPGLGTENLSLFSHLRCTEKHLTYVKSNLLDLRQLGVKNKTKQNISGVFGEINLLLRTR